MSWHFLDLIAVYWDPYMLTVKREYWTAHHRRKIGTVGKYTFWIRSFK